VYARPPLVCVLVYTRVIHFDRARLRCLIHLALGLEIVPRILGPFNHVSERTGSQAWQGASGTLTPALAPTTCPSNRHTHSPRRLNTQQGALWHTRCPTHGAARMTHLGDLCPAREQRAEPRTLMFFGLRRLFSTTCTVYSLNKVTSGLAKESQTDGSTSCGSDSGSCHNTALAKT
jgi:hypothetical protein